MDEDLRRTVMDHIGWDGRLDASGIEVEAEGGRVRLSGRVASALEREAAETDAWLVPGVTSVLNEIRVEYPPGSELPPDDEIRRHVEFVIGVNPELFTDSIHVDVHDGIITLRGTVDYYPKKRRASDLALGVRGVIRVREELAVVPSTRFADRAVAEDLVASLERRGDVDAARVEVTVKDGVVNLSGSVPGREAWLAADHAARLTRGVREVHNDLEIEPGSAGEDWPEPGRSGPAPGSQA